MDTNTNRVRKWPTPRGSTNVRTAESSTASTRATPMRTKTTWAATVTDASLSVRVGTGSSPASLHLAAAPFRVEAAPPGPRWRLGPPPGAGRAQRGGDPGGKPLKGQLAV